MITDDLRIVLELSRTGRLAAAAQRLQLDETTVSRRLVRLERALGTRLVDRERGDWRLTIAGRQLLPHAETIETARVAALDELTRSGQTLSGTVRILAPDGFGAFVLIPGLAPLREEHRDLALEISTSTTHGATTARDFDLAISLERAEARAVRVAPLADYRLRLYASREYIRRCGEPMTVREVINEHTLIWYIDSMLDVQPLRLLDVILPGARALIQCNNITGHLTAARNGLGIAPLPTYIGDHDTELVRVLPDAFEARRTYWIIVPESNLRLRRVDAVLARLHELVAHHPDLESIEAHRTPAMANRHDPI